MKQLINLTLIPMLAAVLLLTNADASEAITPRDLSHLPRVALVIGNGDYTHDSLKNPVNDARDMAAALSGVGFDVTLKLKQSRKGMRQAIRDFGQRLYGDKVGLFYYAGHGTQAAGENYLLPVGASIKCSDEVQDEAVAANLVLRKMESAGNPLGGITGRFPRSSPSQRQGGIGYGSRQRGISHMRNL